MIMWPRREPRCTAALSGQAGSSRRKAFGMDEHDDVQMVERKVVSMRHRPDPEGREVVPDARPFPRARFQCQLPDLFGLGQPFDLCKCLV